MNYWQVAAGSYGREYSKFFLKYGIASVGGEKHVATMESVKLGDVVILKQGQSTILAVGMVVERSGKYKGRKDKTWLNDFDGWNLEAYCYVDWKIPGNPVRVEARELTRPTITRTNSESIKRISNEILKKGIYKQYHPEPPEPDPITVDQLLRFLIKEGLRPSSADELANTISKIRLLAQYYYHYQNWEYILEHETRAFLVVPLLLALGWSEQQLKIELSCEGGKVDIACFRKNYSGEHSECVSVIETKGFASGLDYADSQARSYSQSFPHCKTVVVTNGYCYKIYLREGDHIQASPSAYINLLAPTKRYPLNPDEVGGALDAIRWLLPNNLIVE